MNSRKFLVRLILAMLVIGFGLVGASFIHSLAPTAKAVAALPSVDAANIGRGQAMLIKAPNHLGAFVVRDETGTIHAFRVPISDFGYVQMPDIHWWRPLKECKAFGVQTMGDAPFIGCGDEPPNAFWASAWRWSLSGKSLARPCDNMEPLSFIQDGSTLRFSGLFGG